MIEQISLGGHFRDVSHVVLLQATKELHVEPSRLGLISVKDETLMGKVNEIELRNLRESPCPKGNTHDIRREQVGPNDGNNCNEQVAPVYWMCYNCGHAYFVRYYC
ncbi:MAG: hypothetical protein AABX63_05420 [Nanoarchaeota archaeon]